MKTDPKQTQLHVQVVYYLSG